MFQIVFDFHAASFCFIGFICVSVVAQKPLFFNGTHWFSNTKPTGGRITEENRRKKTNKTKGLLPNTKENRRKNKTTKTKTHVGGETNGGRGRRVGFATVTHFVDPPPPLPLQPEWGPGAFWWFSPKNQVLQPTRLRVHTSTRTRTHTHTHTPIREL